MNDKLVNSADDLGTPRRFKYMGDGTYAERVVAAGSQNITTKFREAFESYNPSNTNRWVESRASGDLVFVDGNAAAASYLVISKDPLTAGNETSVDLAEPYYFNMPTEIAVGLSISQRTLGQEFSVECVDNGELIPDSVDLAILSITQSTTTLTIDFSVPHGLSIGRAIGVRDCSNPLANYPALVVATVPSPTQITCTAGPGGTIASQTITNPAGAKGFVFIRQRLGRARNGVSQIFDNATVTNASLYIRTESGDALPSGTIAGNHSVTVGTTASVQLVNSAYSYAFSPTTEYRLLVQSDRVQIADSPVDSTAQMTNRSVRTQVCPNPANSYKLRFRATNNKSLTVPAAQIVSAVKTGTTTATITTNVPHGLVATDPVVIYGIRDQTNFANLTAATSVASVVDALTFTIVIGTAVTATSYGGYVAKVQGGNLMSALGAIAQVAQSAVLSTLADGTRQLVLTGSATWAGALIGDMVNVVGCRADLTGVSLGVDGPWKVANIATTALTLVLPFQNQRTLPSDFGATNCGGGVIRRTCMRVSFVRIFDYERLRVESLPRPASDAAAAMPVAVQNTPAVTLTSTTVAGTAAVDAGIGNPVTAGLRASNANIAAMSATGDNVAWLGTMIGAGIVKPYALPEAGWNASLSLTTTTAAAIQAAAGAGIKRHLTAIQAINTGGAAVDLIILDGTTERWRLPLPVNVPVAFELPMEIVTTANTALNANLSAAGTVRLNAQGYTAP